MQKDDSGVWSITSDPLEPDYYGYSFVSDGVALIDPSNPLLKPNLLSTQSMVHVPGPSSLPWEINDVPHGVLHHHFYKSGVVGDQRDYYVYTPPGYDAAAKKRKYPVLYLLHGYSDDASGWTAVGRANVILDNLIAQQKARPMIVVMTLGYGAPEIVAHGAVTLSHNDLRQRNLDKYRESLLTEVIPEVEREYRTLTDTNSRAIAGLSMGGSESLFVGLTSNRFAWIGAFSTGGLSDDLNQQLSEMKPDNLRTLKLLWIACGTDDHLFPTNQRIREWLTSKGIKHTDIDTPGAHTWMVWRRNLANFAPLLFQGK
jgi:enterochelin esterase family protein